MNIGITGIFGSRIIDTFNIFFSNKRNINIIEYRYNDKIYHKKLIYKYYVLRK